MSAYDRYIFITETATTDGQCKTNKEAMTFHYFNKNGLVNRKRKNDDVISDLVEAGLVRNGWHFAYGFFSDYEENSIIRLSGLQRVGSSACRVAIRMMEDQCNRAEAKIATVTACA